eukprot:Nitzschia sp. Nitz4//scaffold195_size40117//37913//40184//NITZ4_007582-RA/size40117-snap-gene-0.11-mRNA-1//-1//CDS//3329540383//3503//frame0
MKILITALLFLASTSNGIGAFASSSVGGDDNRSGAFQPFRVSYNSLVEDNKGENTESDLLLLDALTNVGMVSVTNMPASFRQSKKETLEWTHPCVEASAATKEHIFEDGTSRKTIATHTVPGPGGIQAMDHGSSDHGPCANFDRASYEFRQEVDKTTRAFANRVSHLLDASMSGEALLATEDGYEFKTVDDVVDNGEHLEHFHAYSLTESGAAEDGSAPSLRGNRAEDSTIEWHTDQGMFLVFSPGVLAASSENDKKAKDTVREGTDGFFIQLSDGTVVGVDFEDEDDLVIMLGDGVNQVVNPRVADAEHKLRAVPHALSMPAHSEEENRVWYGRMVLPPSSAVHPGHGETFGYLRQVLIDASTSKSGNDQIDHLSLGCSSPSMFARQLETSSCEEGTMYCWHRCMALSDFGVSDEICSLDLWCTNPRGQLWDDTHGDWYPGCLDSATAPNASAYPVLPDYPRDEDICSETAYIAYLNSKASEYDFQANLTNGGTLLWSITEDDTIDGMLSYNGLFGYVAFGYAGDLSTRNAMYGSKLIMATPSLEYSPVTGFDFSLDAIVEEYMIGTSSAFRHWQSPLTAVSRSELVSNSESYSVEETDCFTSMTFDTAGIYDMAFNISGSDEMIWAANGVDSFAGYHGSARGIISIAWSEGSVTLEDGTVVGESTEDTPSDGKSGALRNMACSGMVAMMSLGSLMAML